ncbi:malate dehydrogenase-like [Ostrinia nubilalis]|uniref:malate dehydrogenase-like n=1 Tax=Ostrinia nubilalis TaxID=29057 RepID=UPI003082635D
MLVAKKLLTSQISNIVTSVTRNYKVTIVGGASEIGQTVSLMLRAQPSITKLNIHDTLNQTPGVILDLSHIPAESILKGFSGEETLERALKDSDIVLATGGSTRTPGTSKKTWLSNNTEFIKMFSSKIAKINPFPFVGILTEPINILVPMSAEIMRNHGDYDPKKLFGIATIDHLRAQSLYALENNLNPRNCMVPVIGGRSGKTAIPLISQAKPACPMNEKTIQEFTSRIRKCDENIMDAKKGWSSTLSPAYGALMFTRSVLEALDGRPAKVAAYIENNDFGTNYFAGIVNVNSNGAAEMQRYTDLSKFECHLLERSIEQIRKDVIKGKKILELA